MLRHNNQMYVYSVWKMLFFCKAEKRSIFQTIGGLISPSAYLILVIWVLVITSLQNHTNIFIIPCDYREA